MRYLVVAAHPDDEVLGAGASVFHWSSRGAKVAVAVMCTRAQARADISDTLAEDEEEAAKVLGVSRTYGADFPNIKMNTVPHLELVQFIESCILDFRPDVIVTHHPSDVNVDHAVTSGAAQAAARLFQRRTDVSPLRGFMYMEVPSSTEWSLQPASQRFCPNHFVQIGREGLERKLEALSCYKGVMRDYPHPRSEEALRGLAAFRGAQAGCSYAEAFESVFSTDM